MKVSLIEYPSEKDWIEVQRRALVTVGKKPINPPTMYWKQKILNARHSPIRYLRFSFLIENVPSWIATHMARHVHAQPYIKSQRNDRQKDYDRRKATQDAPVDMIFDCGGEEIQIIANKRLCQQASQETRELVQMMCWLVEEKCPEFKGLLVPMCIYHGGVCHEMKSCERCGKRAENN